MADILQKTSSNVFLRMKRFVFLLMFHWILFELTINNIGSGNGLAPNRLEVVIGSMFTKVYDATLRQ